MNRLGLLTIALLLLAPPVRLSAAPPAWWSDADTRILATGQASQNYAPANLGQLKHTATQAKKHLDTQLAAVGGAGPEINALVASFTPTGGHTPATRAANYAPANLGQLKAVAKPFYDRLLAIGYDTRQSLIDHGAAGWAYDYPWNPATPVAQNYSPANLGQLKWVFSFDLTADADEDNVPDWWEAAYLHDSLNQADNLTDFGINRGINSFATKQSGEPDHAGSAGGKSLWFRWQPAISDSVVFETAGSRFDTLLAVYTGVDVASLTLVASDDDNGPGNTSRVAFQAQAGVTYWIAIDGYSGASGAYTLQWARDNSDPDEDGMPAIFERLHGLSVWINDAALNNDTDTLTNLQEWLAGTNPSNYDSDEDLLPDDWELAANLDPNSPAGSDGAGGDVDEDGLSNLDEYLNATDPENEDTDDDGTNDGDEVDQGGDPNNDDDGGAAPPTEEMKDVPFNIGGDYAAWEMTVTGKGPNDQRVQKLVTNTPGETNGKNLKLRRGNTYEVRMRWLKSKLNEELTWWCWEAGVDSLPSKQTFEDYTTTRLPDVAMYFMAGGHWLVDNTDGLLSAHTHMNEEDGTNVAGSAVATLLPVDIDVIHPASGELSDGKEDTGDGGYVSVRRMVDGQDVTPKTKLVVRAVGGAQSGWKTRLKCNPGDRYKIYSDEARTQEVTSESTEFDATQETTLYFQGLKKSTSRGGEEIKMQVKVGSSPWTDGDSLKCTVVQSEFVFQVKAFIPYVWTEGEDLWYVPDQNNPMAGKVAKGDDRTFRNVYSDDVPQASGGHFEDAPFRVCQMVVITPFKELHDTPDIQAKRKLMTAPTSDHYLKSTSVDSSEMSLHYGYVALSGNPSSSGKPPSSREHYDFVKREGRVAEVTVEGAGKDGALGFIGSSNVPYTSVIDDIHWRLYLKVWSESDPLHPTVEFGGRHDRYPAYEIIVIQSDGTYKDIHRVPPNPGDRPGPDSLDDDHGRNVGRSDTVE